MSTVQIAVADIGLSRTRHHEIISAEMPVAAEVITSTASSQAAVLSQGEDSNRVWRVSVSGSDNVYVAFGASPTASATTGFLCHAGGTYWFRTSDSAPQVAVVNV